MNDKIEPIELRTPLRDGAWNPGEQAVFTYSLGFDENSEICARLFGRTGQTVTILNRGDDDADLDAMPTIAERGEEACLAVYGIRFPDGREDTAFEDELSEVSS